MKVKLLLKKIENNGHEVITICEVNEHKHEIEKENINVIIIATGLRRFDLENFNTHNMVRGPSHIVELESDGYINTDDLNKVDIKNVFGRLKN